MNTNNVRFTRYFVWRYFVFNSECFGTFGSQAATPGNHKHAKGPRARNHFRTNLSDTNETQLATKQAARFGKLFLVPFAAAQSNDIVGDSPIERENERKGQFSHSYGIFTRTIRNVAANGLQTIAAGLFELVGD